MSDITTFTFTFILTFTFTFFIQISLYVQLTTQMQTPPKKGRDIITDIFSRKTTSTFWRQNTLNPRHMAPKYLEHFIISAPPLFILDLLLWIGSAYVSLYINSCSWFNKALTNLTLLPQHQLQYTGGLVETQGLLLPSLYFFDACQCYSSDTSHKHFSSFQDFL